MTKTKEKWVTIQVLEGSEVIPPNKVRNVSLTDAFAKLQRTLRKDKEYYHTWMCNIQMCQYDAMMKNKNIVKGKKLTQKEILDITQGGAKLFLTLLCD